MIASNSVSYPALAVAQKYDMMPAEETLLLIYARVLRYHAIKEAPLTQQHRRLALKSLVSTFSMTRYYKDAETIAHDLNKNLYHSFKTLYDADQAKKDC